MIKPLTKALVRNLLTIVIAFAIVVLFFLYTGLLNFSPNTPVYERARRVTCQGNLARLQIRLKESGILMTSENVEKIQQTIQDMGIICPSGRLSEKRGQYLVLIRKETAVVSEPCSHHAHEDIDKSLRRVKYELINGEIIEVPCFIE